MSPSERFGADAEHSFIPFGRDFELRAVGEGKLPELVGYPIVWGAKSEKLGWFEEVVNSECKIDSGDVMSLYDHQTSLILARESTGRLELVRDRRGLKATIRPVDTQYARDMVACIESGELQGMSVIRLTKGDDWDDDATPPLRTITHIELLSVDVVSMPAYPDTSIALRSLNTHRRGGKTPAGDMRLRLMQMKQEAARWR